MTTSEVPIAPPAEQEDLETRINTRRKALIAVLVKLKRDPGLETVKERDQIKGKLTELAHIVEQGVVDGWASVSEVATLKLDHWLAESARHLAPKNGRS